MSPLEFISKKTRTEFQEHFVGKTLRQIEQAFDAADVPCDTEHQPPVGGQRRGLVAQYYHTVNWSSWRDVRRVVHVFENELIELRASLTSDSPQIAEWARGHLAMLTRWLEKDSFVFDGLKLSYVGKTKPVDDVLISVKSLDLPELHRQLQRLREATEEDPALAVGTAKELVETTCKTILGERGQVIDPSWDVVRLCGETRKALKLLPDDIPESVKGSDMIRRVLGNLGSVAHGLAELRNLYGTGHGKDGKHRAIAPRHARLAVGAASTLCAFLLETHSVRE